MDKTIVGKRVRRQREYLGLTREQFAEKVDISWRFLAEIENGTKGMSAETLYKICTAFGISADHLLLGRENLSSAKTPCMELLSKVPPSCTSYLENILKAYLRTIDVIKDEME